jgi:protein-L-isoaspartate(D-aspartate) O-methyltransferase
MNFEQARFNMIEQQIRTWEVLDAGVLDLLHEVRREDFVPPEHQALAFADLEVPLGHGEAMMQPKVEARIVQELALQSHETVYEVGTGSGYLTALPRAPRPPRDQRGDPPDLKARAGTNLAAAGIANVTLLEGDSAQRPLADGTYDAIVITGSTPVLARAFLERLAPGGRLFVVLGDPPVMKATLVRQLTPGSQQHVELFETVLKPLVNAPQPSRFRF